ncbi:ferredoxin-NADP+ reductase [Fusarium austroafricanum]|uniref:NADPH:adrenodoxin oxidoreductase, mitochondrial n=1 Tax=Fusarium austroafricanum TaxID=2364996 RepID=A0A8H4KCK6_9HYPO|nr:ferredoxin-NADP+ reductase [Fusarium austroafricanum]
MLSIARRFRRQDANRRISWLTSYRHFSSTLQQSSRSPDAPFRMAVVGSGPAGFYTAYRVMGKIPGVKVDMYESLPVPFGLNCQDKFDEIASQPNFTFIGNASIGHQGHSSKHCTIELQNLMNHYNAVLFAYGASEDKKLGIPGESTLSGIHSAREVVGWYNGLPGCSDLNLDLSQAGEAVVIGQGNVALDVARILLEDIDVLRKTDITEKALETLSKSRVKRVHVVGRRGPMQASFTIKEVRELMKLKEVAFLPFNRLLIPEDLKALPRASKRLMEVLVKGSTTPVEAASKAWSLDSCLSPKHFLGNQEAPSQVASTEFDITKLATPFDPKSSVSATGETKILPSDVVFRSVGYKSVALPGFAKIGIQFDESRGVVDNDGLGRVTRMVSDTHAGGAHNERVPGVYCAGWVKNGPTGVIASTMQDAFTTGDAIVHDWLSGGRFLNASSNTRVSGWEGLRDDAGPTTCRAVAWNDWRQIDRAERERGQRNGKEREKFTSTEDMLAVLE